MEERERTGIGLYFIFGLRLQIAGCLERNGATPAESMQARRGMGKTRE
jgi:hypothetical protein